MFLILFFNSSIRLVGIDFVTFNLKIAEKKLQNFTVHSYTNEFVFPYTKVQFSFSGRIKYKTSLGTVKYFILPLITEPPSR